MSRRSNSGRIRTSVELGATCEMMLRKIIARGNLRERYGYFGRLTNAVMIRWAIVQLYRQLFPECPAGNIGIYLVGDQNAQGQSDRRSPGR